MKLIPFGFSFLFKLKNLLTDFRVETEVKDFLDQLVLAGMLAVDSSRVSIDESFFWGKKIHIDKQFDVK